MADRNNSRGNKRRNKGNSQAKKKSASGKKINKNKKQNLKTHPKGTYSKDQNLETSNIESKSTADSKSVLKDNPTSIPNNTSLVSFESKEIAQKVSPDEIDNLNSSKENNNAIENNDLYTKSINDSKKSDFIKEDTNDNSEKLSQDNLVKAKETYMNKKKNTSSNIKKSTSSNKNKRQNNVKSNASKGKKSKSKKKKIFKWIGLSALFIFLATTVIVLGYVISIIKNTPPVDVNKVLSNQQTAKFTYGDGTPWTQLNSETERKPLKPDDIPEDLKNAIVAIEDERFYSHPGVDIKRLIGATVHTVAYKITGKGGLQGGSTLTQQLVKNTLLTNEKSIERKIKEMYLSLELEKSLTKEQILTAYLNSYPVGGVAYGAEAGAEMYFDKSAKDLNLIQCAFLAGITQAPTTYSPFTEAAKKDPSKYINRTKLVLGKMLEHQYITQEEYDKAIKDLNDGKLKFKTSKRTYKLPHEDFLYPTLDQVKRDLKAKYQYSDEEIDSLISTGGITIHSTMNKAVQEHTQQVLNNYSNFRLAGYDQVDKNGVPLVQAAACITDVHTGEVIAMVGGRGNQSALSTNRAYSALNPVGSSVKPFTVYGPAIDSKVMTAGSTIYDAPIPPSVSSYNPKNSPDVYRGLIPLRDSLKWSSNVGATLTELKVGLETGVAYGEEFGLKFNDASKNSLPALALGQFDNNPNDLDGGNPFIVASAISTFGNGGVYVEPRLYTKVTDQDGNIILESKEETKQIISPQAAYIVYDMMKGPITYNAGGAKWGDMPVAGKTGTTTDSKDLWFAGLTPHYGGAVWIGRDDNKMLPAGRSSSTAASIWGKIMKFANEGLSTKDIQKPSGIVEVPICSVSGKLATSLCRHQPKTQYTRGVYTEMFISGTEPTSYCETHVSAQVNSINGKLAGPNTPSGLLTNRIFINYPYPNPEAADSKFYLTSEQDDTVAPPPEPTKPEEDDDDSNDSDSNDSENEAEDADEAAINAEDEAPEPPAIAEKPDKPDKPDKDKKPDKH